MLSTTSIIYFVNARNTKTFLLATEEGMQLQAPSEKSQDAYTAVI